MHRSFHSGGNAEVMASFPREDHQLLARVAAEFREMPGLVLTVAQAARLFSIDRLRCARVLAALVTSGDLRTDGHAFARADEGASAR